MKIRPTSWRAWSALVTFGALAAMSVGCGDEGGTQVPTLDGGSDLANAPDGGDIGEIGSSYLESHNPRPGEALRLFHGSDANLEIGFYGPDMSPIQGANLTFEIVSSSMNCHMEGQPCIRLASLGAPTDETGMAQVRVSAGSKDGDATIRIAVEGQDAVDPIEVVVQSRAKESYDLVVHFEYGGARTFPTVKPLLFARTADLQTCADLYTAPLRDPNVLPTATRSTPDLPVGTSGVIPDARFTSLPNNTTWLAAGYALTQGGLVTVHGCTQVEGGPAGTAQEATVILEEVPILIAGTYTLTSNFNLLSGLPRRNSPTESMKLGDWVDLVVGLFQSPAQVIVDYLLPYVEDIGGFDIPDGFEPFIVNLLNDLLVQYAPEWLGNTLVVGSDVGDILTNFQLEGEFVIAGEPDANGVLPPGNLHRYTGVSFKWRLPCVRSGTPVEQCDNVQGLTFTQLGRPDLAVQGQFTGAVSECDGATGECLNINLHGMTLPYGEIALALIEGWVFPELFGPSVDSVDAFIQQIIIGKMIEWYNGGRDPADWVNATGCTGVGQVIERVTNTGSIGRSIGEFICDTGVGYLVDLIKGTAAGLTLETENNLQLATNATRTCRLIDTDGNLEYDLIGNRAQPTTRCNWDIQFSWNGTTPVALTGRFHAARGR